MDLQEAQAIVRWGKAGMAMMAMRVVSLVAIVGVIGMCFFVGWKPSWEGVACVALLAGCFIRANQDESRRVAVENGGQ